MNTPPHLTDSETNRRTDHQTSPVPGHQARLSWFGGAHHDTPPLRTDGGTDSSANTDTDAPTDSDRPDDGSAGTDCADADFPLTPSVRAFLRAQHNNECDLCSADGDDEDVTLSIHHRTQRQHGGTNNPSNLVLLCRTCHRRHHDNTPIEERDSITNSEPTTTDMSTDTTPDDPDSESSDPAEPSDRPAADGGAAEPTTSPDDDSQPLPPQTTPNEADKEILSLLEEHGPLSTGELATLTGYSTQYVRRQCWKLGGEQLIVPRADKTWNLQERTTDETVQIGLPDDPKEAQRAGRDEVIRKMSAHGMTHTKIAEITGLARGTIDIAVNRARALRIDDPADEQVDLATIATRLSALLELIDHEQMESIQQSD